MTPAPATSGLVSSAESGTGAGRFAMLTWLAAVTLMSLPSAIQAQPRQAPPKPKLIVVISVDQFSTELYQRYLRSYTGGLRTLSRGVSYPVSYQSHSGTETCPGHSTILTGRHPSGTGIISNSWIDRRTGQSVYCVAVPGTSDPTARGPQHMRATTLGDWMKAALPGSRSFSVSFKDRAAVTMGGQTADGVYWWNDGIGFASSSFAAPSTAESAQAVRRFNATVSAKWAQATPVLWPSISNRCATLQKPYRFGQVDFSGKVPPDYAASATRGVDFQKTTVFHNNLRSSPLADTLLLQFAEQLIEREQLGRGPATDLLALGFSANDAIGHRYGNGGAEMCVQQEALDRTLGRLLEHLTKLNVPMVVVLTADHGGTDAAEREADHDPAASRLDSRKFMQDANSAVRAALALDFDPLDGDEQQLYIRTGEDPTLRAKVADATVTWLRKQPKVREVFTRREVEATQVAHGTSPERLTMLERLSESFDNERSGDIFVVFEPRTSYGLPTKPGDYVAGHGSPWDHDRQVPILFWWPEVRKNLRDVPAETVDIAPTLAAAIGVPSPDAIDGRCLVVGYTCPRR